MFFLEHCRQVLAEIVDLLSKDRSPLCNTRPANVLDPNIQRQLTHFSLITHGFGAPTFVATLNTIQSILTEMLKTVDKIGNGANGGGTISGNGAAHVGVAQMGNSTGNGGSVHSHSQVAGNSGSLMGAVIDTT